MMNKVRENSPVRNSSKKILVDAQVDINLTAMSSTDGTDGGGTGIDSLIKAAEDSSNGTPVVNSTAESTPHQKLIKKKRIKIK